MWLSGSSIHCNPLNRIACCFFIVNIISFTSAHFHSGKVVFHNQASISQAILKHRKKFPDWQGTECKKIYINQCFTEHTPSYWLNSLSGEATTSHLIMWKSCSKHDVQLVFQSNSQPHIQLVLQGRSQPDIQLVFKSGSQPDIELVLERNSRPDIELVLERNSRPDIEFVFQRSS